MILALISFDWKVMALRTESKWGLCSHHHISIQFWLGSGVGGSGVCCLYYTHPLRFKSAKRAVVLWYYEWWNDLLSLETWLIRRYMGLILLNSYVAHIANSYTLTIESESHCFLPTYPMPFRPPHRQKYSSVRTTSRHRSGFSSKWNSGGQLTLQKVGLSKLVARGKCLLTVWQKYMLLLLCQRRG